MVRREAGDPRELRGVWMRWEEGETSAGAEAAGGA